MEPEKPKRPKIPNYPKLHCCQDRHGHGLSNTKKENFENNRKIRKKITMLATGYARFVIKRGQWIVEQVIPA